jgi:DNA-binding NtrC family response regulator
VPPRTIQNMTEPGDTAATSPELFGDEDTAAHTQIVDTRTSVHVRRVRLSVQTGPAAGREFAADKERIRIGNARVPPGHDGSGNDLALDDKKVSRFHAEISLTEKGWLLTDLDSTNGTWLDGKRIERAYISPGSMMVVGDSSILFAPIDEEIVAEPDQDGRFGEMVGRSLKMRQIFGLLKKIAPMDVGVLITGETGTGKELVARGLHDYSARKKGPFVVLDCGSIPENLIESELFGHEKGSFTGATVAREGAFERASGGTIFLDEIGELRFDMQPRLLRVLENREVRRVGGGNVIDVDVRVVAATNRDLAKEVQEGNFREDLFFRLNIINVQLPPLRARREDIPHLVQAALAAPELLERHGQKRVSPAAMSALQNYAWPGNVRELMNVISHLLTFSEGPDVDVQHLPPRLTSQGAKQPLPFNEHLGFHEAKEQLLESFEREYLSALLKRCEGNISRAARESGLHRKSIERLVKKYDLDARAHRK